MGTGNGNQSVGYILHAEGFYNWLLVSSAKNEKRVQLTFEINGVETDSSDLNQDLVFSYFRDTGFLESDGVLFAPWSRRSALDECLAERWDVRDEHGEMGGLVKLYAGSKSAT